MPPHPFDPRPLQTGLIALHSNRTEQLAETTLAYIHALRDLEHELTALRWLADSGS